MSPYVEIENYLDNSRDINDNDISIRSVNNSRILSDNIQTDRNNQIEVTLTTGGFSGYIPNMGGFSGYIQPNTWTLPITANTQPISASTWSISASTWDTSGNTFGVSGWIPGGSTATVYSGYYDISHRGHNIPIAESGVYYDFAIKKYIEYYNKAYDLMAEAVKEQPEFISKEDIKI